MSKEAELTMMLYKGLLPDEEIRLKAMESSILKTLFENHITARPFWISRGAHETRVVQLVIPGQSGKKILLEITPKDVVNISDHELISLLIQRLSEK